MCYKRIVSVIVFGVILNSVTIAQGEAAIPFLLLPISPSQNAMGATGTSIPTDDPYGFLINPAQLGHTSQTTNLSFIFYPSKVNWLGFDGLTLSGIALNLGYNFKNLVGIPLSIGFGFANPELNYGEFFRTGGGDPNPNGTFEPKDYYNEYSLGIGIDCFVQLNAGVTYKDITSILSDRPIGEESGYGRAEVSTIDYGFLLNIPIIKLIDDKLSINIIDDIPIKPYLNFSTGYARSNIGDEVYYIDPAQSDPLPRTARLGYGISLGFDFLIDESPFSFIKLDFSVDAEDILIERASFMYGFKYQNGIGDIDIGRNIIQIKGDDKVVTHSGYRIYLMETLGITNGKFSGRGFDLSTTSGIEIRATGLLKMLGKYSSDKVFEFIANHFDLRYYRTTYSSNKFDTEMDGIALFISRLEFN